MSRKITDMNDFNQNVINWLSVPGNSQAELSRLSGQNEAMISRIVNDPDYEPGHYKALKLIAIINPKKKEVKNLMDVAERMIDRLERENERLTGEIERLLSDPMWGAKTE